MTRATPLIGACQDCGTSIRLEAPGSTSCPGCGEARDAQRAHFEQERERTQQALAATTGEWAFERALGLR